MVELTPHPKALTVRLPLQVLGGSERVQLVRAGPVSSGRREHPTPTGEFNLQWKSRRRESTVDPTWYMEWCFNFHNEQGSALHPYALSWRPASRACNRLLRGDVRWLYGCGEGWRLDGRGWEERRPGITLWILSHNDFDAPPPWLEESEPHPRTDTSLRSELVLGNEKE